MRSAIRSLRHQFGAEKGDVHSVRGERIPCIPPISVARVEHLRSQPTGKSNGDELLIGTVEAGQIRMIGELFEDTLPAAQRRQRNPPAVLIVAVVIPKPLEE